MNSKAQYNLFFKLAQRTQLIDIFGLILIWIISLIVVNPIGEFPLNDDWAYASNVFHLVKKGEFVLSDWPAMTLIGHTIWGTAFAKLLGFSFLSLRLSNWIAAFVAMVFIYLIIVKNTHRSIAIIASLGLGFSPVFFSLSFTFMTDVTFMAAMCGALYFYHRYFLKPKLKDIIMASVFAFVAAMIRQPVVIIPFVFIFTHFLVNKEFKTYLAYKIFFAFLVLGGLTAYTYVLKINCLLPENFGSIDDLIESSTRSGLLYNIFFRSIVLLMFSGLFLLPVSIIILPSIWKQSSIRLKLGILLISVVVSIPVWMNLQYFPTGNVFYNMGLGPKVLKDTYWGINLRPLFSPAGLFVFYTLTLLGSISLVVVLIKQLSVFRAGKKVLPHTAIKLFSLALLVVYVFFLLLGKYFFDRYFIPVLFLLGIIILPENIKINKLTRVFSVLILSCYIWFSVAATHDYLAWNSARWSGLNHLIETGVNPKNIDGGFEFNAWYNTSTQNELNRTGKSWWFVDNDDYVLSFGELPGYYIEEVYYYRSYLTLYTDSVCILKREVSLDSK
ncbi:MAG: glycosyltransferase family 39 protein [Bacteroidales bacterium]|nr:glycosyltransferase family 39 protein [Bacteroidales bacterium]MCF8405684.1 glycosyltransferase family 39 protein [Bacteroidales bacterium]